jgi:ribose transport system substrate-binding protein
MRWLAVAARNNLAYLRSFANFSDIFCFSQQIENFCILCTNDGWMNRAMTTYERHQSILRLLHEQGSIAVTELADSLDVSEATIRNDLTALEEQQLLTRIRGGAVSSNAYPIASPFQSRVQVNGDAKKKIARWAAELVTDGDVILLDASTTAYMMATYLQGRHNITVVTNQLEAARLLSADVSKRVILLGGILRADGLSVTGEIGQEVLRNLHINTAFISCAGFSFAAGLMEADMEEARLKEQALQSASKVVALVDSSKFGKVGLRPFASLRQISHIVTDDEIEASTIQRLRDANVALTICGSNSVQSLMHEPAQQRSYKIGFANLSEQLNFPIEVRRGLERAAKQARDIDLIYVDNDLNSERAIALTDELIARHVDLVIEYQIDEAAGHIIMNRFQQHRIPVIAIDIPMVGATYFGVDNFVAGKLAGEALGNWLRQHWDGALDYVLVLEERRAGALPAARIQGQLEGLQAVIGALDPQQLLYLDSGNNSATSYHNVYEQLLAITPECKLGIVCFNDDAALGALKAVEALGREATTAIVGQGADRPMRDALRRGASPLIGSTAFMPEAYGEKILALAARLLAGEAVQPAVYMEHTFVDRGNIDQLYPEDYRRGE